ncbi:hypothetical protein PCE1_003605 [Barthelona sp. PCE]
MNKTDSLSSLSLATLLNMRSRFMEDAVIRSNCPLVDKNNRFSDLILENAQVRRIPDFHELESIKEDFLSKDLSLLSDDELSILFQDFKELEGCNLKLGEVATAYSCDYKVIIKVLDHFLFSKGVSIRFNSILIPGNSFDSSKQSASAKKIEVFTDVFTEFFDQLPVFDDCACLSPFFGIFKAMRLSKKVISSIMHIKDNQSLQTLVNQMQILSPTSSYSMDLNAAKCLFLASRVSETQSVIQLIQSIIVQVLDTISNQDAPSVDTVRGTDAHNRLMALKDDWVLMQQRMKNEEKGNVKNNILIGQTATKVVSENPRRNAGNPLELYKLNLQACLKQLNLKDPFVLHPFIVFLGLLNLDNSEMSRLLNCSPSTLKRKLKALRDANFTLPKRRTGPRNRESVVLLEDAVKRFLDYAVNTTKQLRMLNEGITLSVQEHVECGTNVILTELAPRYIDKFDKRRKKKKRKRIKTRKAAKLQKTEEDSFIDPNAVGGEATDDVTADVDEKSTNGQIETPSIKEVLLLSEFSIDSELLRTIISNTFGSLPFSSNLNTKPEAIYFTLCIGTVYEDSFASLD